MEVTPTSASAPSRPRWTPMVKLAVSSLIIVAFASTLYTFRFIFIPVVIGGIIAYVMYPLVRRIRTSSRLPHGLATSILYVLLLAIIVRLLFVVFPLVVDSLIFLRDQAVVFAQTLQQIQPGETVELLGFELQVQALTNELSEMLLGFLRDTARDPFMIVSSVAEMVLAVIFTFLLGFYFTRDTGQIIDWFEGLVPRDYRNDMRQLMSEINTIWSSFFRGQVMLSTLVAILMTGVATVLGLPQPLLIGILYGVLDFLPSIGQAIWLATALTLALIEGSTHLPVSNVAFALIVAGTHLVFTQFEMNVLIPRIIGAHIHLHPMVILIGLIVGAAIGGVLGVALAAPTIATLRILMRYVYAMMFDLDPFPMVGPPSATKEERLAELARLQEGQARHPFFERLAVWRRHTTAADAPPSQHP